MKKILLTFLCVLACVISTSYYVKPTNAMQYSTNSLDYFELNNPVSICSYNNKICIAEKNKVIVYHDYVFDCATVSEINIKKILNYKDYLFILTTDNKLYLFDLIQMILNTNKLLEDEVLNFDIYNDLLTISKQVGIEFYEIVSNETFSLNKIENNFQTSIICSNVICASDQTNFYFNDKGILFKMIKQDLGSFGQVSEQKFDSITEIKYYNDLYVLSNNGVYKLNQTQFEKILQLDQSQSNVTDFFVDDKFIYICDNKKSVIAQYDKETNAFTNFEISFTKIDLPKDFSLNYQQNLKYVTVESETSLYHINYESTIKNGYFTFNKYYVQPKQERYLVVYELENYYLISGEIMALVLKSDYQLNNFETPSENKTCYVTIDCNAFKIPQINENYTLFNIKRHSEVTVLSTFEFYDVTYCHINYQDKFGYVPAQLLIDNLNKQPDKLNFFSATTCKRPTTLYKESDFSTSLITIPKSSPVVVYKQTNDYYYVCYNDNYGYVKKQAIVPQGFYTNRNVAIVIIVSLSITATMIFFEYKYFFKKSKK